MPVTNLNNSFPNPYQGCVEADNYRRLNADILKEDYDFIKLLRVESGTLQNTVNIIWKKLCNELRTRGITSAGRQEDFERFVLDCQLIAPGDIVSTATGGVVVFTGISRSTPRSVAGGTMSETPQGHDGGRAKTVGRRAKKSNS